MRRLLASFALLAAVAWTPTLVYGQGTVIDTSFFSVSLGEERSATVYLPEGYFADPSAEYPVVYFLHGDAGTHVSYAWIHAQLDELIDDQVIDPVIFVKPDGSTDDSRPPYRATWFANSELNGPFEDFVVLDLVAFVDQNYRTATQRGQRAIMGHSMGATAAMQMALRHPDVYGGIASIDGVLDFDHFIELVPIVLDENEGPPYDFEPIPGSLTEAYFGLSGAYSPNLENEPYLVDFLLDEEGQVVDSTFAKWLLHDPIYLASNLSPSTDLAIYFTVGLQSFLLQPNRAFDAFLSSEGWEYTYHEHPGGHGTVPFRVPIEFLTSAMTAPTAIQDEQMDNGHPLTLSAPAPNPTAGRAALTYTLTEPAHVRIALYDILGREVAVLVEGARPTGQHEVTVDASRLAPGLYVARLQAGSEVATRRLTVVR
jgi:enterochelin esterase-like enzyme